MSAIELTTSLHLAYKAMRKNYRQLAELHGLAPAQLAALEKLWREDGLTVSELGEKLQLKNSTITVLADRMERDGLVTRSRDEGDRRLVKLYLTPKSKTLQERIPDFNQHIMETIRGDLSEGYIKTLNYLLQQFTSALGKHGVSAD